MRKRSTRIIGGLTIFAVCGMGVLAMAQRVEEPKLDLVCTLSSKELQARRTGIIKELRELAEARQELENGWSLRFSETQVDDLVEFIRLERKCCAFMEFALRFEANKGPVWLTVTGPVGAKGIIASELGGVETKPESK